MLILRRKTILKSLCPYTKKTRIHRFWKRPGTTNAWWENVINDKVIAEEWRENFGMAKASFIQLCNELRPYLLKQTTQMRKPLTVEAQLGVTLYYLSDEAHYRKIANGFGIGKATVSKIIRRVCYVISKILGPKYIRMPNTKREIMTSVSNFYKKFGFSECLGAVDGTHIDIKQPKCNSTAYINRKSRYSINVQACCDHNYCFTDVVLQWPGSVHDAIIFANSKINQKFRSGDMASCAREIVPGERKVPVLILGDPAYPLLPYLMKEYANGGSTRQEQYFGLTLCRARMVIECAFGRLKARFPMLRRVMDINIDDIPYVIYSCFILHNYSEAQKDTLPHENICAAISYDREFQPPTQNFNFRMEAKETEGKAIRRVLTKYFDP